MSETKSLRVMLIVLLGAFALLLVLIVLVFTETLWQPRRNRAFDASRRISMPGTSYLHGAGLAYGPLLLADTRWAGILEKLMPRAFAAMDAARSRLVMSRAENNPVVAAFALCAAHASDSATGIKAPLRAIEWDAWCCKESHDAYEAAVRAGDAAKAAAAMEETVSSMVVAHGTVSSFLLELLGHDCYGTIVSGTEIGPGGVKAAQWMRLFGRALALSHGFDDSDSLSWQDAVAVLQRIFGDAGQLRIVLDLKSRFVRPAFLHALIGEMNRRDVIVEFVGAFERRLTHPEPERIHDLDLRTIVQSTSLVKAFAGCRGVRFVHGPGELEGLDEELEAGDAFMFNAGFLIRHPPSLLIAISNAAKVLTGSRALERLVQAQYEMDVDALEDLAALQKRTGAVLGIYAQEYNMDQAAVGILSEIMLRYGHAFAGLGLAWGGPTVDTPWFDDIVGSCLRSATGTAMQLYSGKPWKRMRLM